MGRLKKEQELGLSSIVNKVLKNKHIKRFSRPVGMAFLAGAVVFGVGGCYEFRGDVSPDGLRCLLNFPAMKLP